MVLLGIGWARQWLPKDDEPGTRTIRGVDHNKAMLMIVWNPNDFHLIGAIPKAEKCSARYSFDDIRTPICQRLIAAGKRNLIIHLDNSPCHTAKVVLDFVPQKKLDLPRILHIPQTYHHLTFSFSGPSNASCEALVFRQLRGFLLRYENRWVKSHLKCYWTFFTTGIHTAKV
jgi:hypothetical protein